MHSQTAIVVIKAIVSLVYFSFMSRLLTPDDFGYFALIMAVVSVLNSLSEAGLGSAIIQKKEAPKAFISTAFTLSAVLGLAFGLFLLLSANYLSGFLADSDILTKPLMMLAPVVFLQAVNSITWSLYMRKLDFFKFGILQVIANILANILGVILAYKGFGFYAIVWVTIADQAFLTLILVVLRKYVFSFMICGKYVREILSYGGWLTASVITRNLTSEIDKVIIGKLLPIADLGAINRPSGFVSRISSQCNGIFDTILFPILSSVQDNKEKVRNAFIKAISIIVVMSATLGACVILGSKYVIDIFFGNQWEFLQPILMLFGLGMIFDGFSRICDCFFRSLGVVKQYFMMRLINGILVISLVTIGCFHGLLGVAVCLVIANALSVTVKFIVIKRYVDISYHQVLKAYARNTGFVFVLLAACLAIFLIMPYGQFYSVFVFLFCYVMVTIFYPSLFGDVYVNLIVNRYLKRLSPLRFDLHQK